MEPKVRRGIGLVAHDAMKKRPHRMGAVELGTVDGK